MVNQLIANSVIFLLKESNVDGETMEYIIEQVGMRDQMIRQLVHAPLELMGSKISADAIRGQIEDKEPEYDSAGFVYNDNFVFTEKELIDYTREIQSRALAAVTAAVKSSRVDMESYVELDLYGRNIEVEVDCDSICDEIIDNIKDVFETDDDSIKDEMSNVLIHLAQEQG